jgi:hypothetical protein
MIVPDQFQRLWWVGLVLRSVNGEGEVLFLTWIGPLSDAGVGGSEGEGIASPDWVGETEMCRDGGKSCKEGGELHLGGEGGRYK